MCIRDSKFTPYEPDKHFPEKFFYSACFPPKIVAFYKLLHQKQIRGKHEIKAVSYTHLVVGDIDVDKIEAKIKKIFSPIKMPDNPAEREYFQVPDNKETIVAIETDKEQANPVAYLCYKHEDVYKRQQ